jgi:hypothetical protein
MTLDVINKLLQAMLTYHVVFYATGSRLPLKVINAIIIIIYWLPTWKRIVTFSSLQSTTLFKHPFDQV